MSQVISPLAGKPAPASILIDVTALLAAYYERRPNPELAAERVSFGTSGHRGSSLDTTFNEWHVLAITQAICDWRKRKWINGPLYLGVDTHALSRPAFESALQVLAANGVEVRVAPDDGFTPTPAVSHAILTWNRGRGATGLADGIVVTPSHNPPRDGGFKYNPPNGGPADSDITKWIGDRANEYLGNNLDGVQRVSLSEAYHADTTREHDFLSAYVEDLGNVVDFDAIRGAGIRMGVDPLGGAGLYYWGVIAERYRLDLTLTSDDLDPQFGFMSVDWDGQIRMDPSSEYAMQRVLALKDRFDVAFACDTDHDRHGVVTKSAGLMVPNHYLSALASEIFALRPDWPAAAKLGKTVVTTAMLDRVARDSGRGLYEVPVGFKWFAPGLFEGALALGCEESAGASLLRRDGHVWTTDKDGIALALLSGEIMAHAGRDPGEIYARLEKRLGHAHADRIQAPANTAQKKALSSLSPEQVRLERLAGEKVEAVLDRAPGNGEPIGGIKVVTASGWFAARPSGTEDIYKVYAESFKDHAHLHALLDEAQQVVNRALADVASPAAG